MRLRRLSRPVVPVVVIHASDSEQRSLYKRCTQEVKAATSSQPTVLPRSSSVVKCDHLAPRELASTCEPASASRRSATARPMARRLVAGPADRRKRGPRAACRTGEMPRHAASLDQSSEQLMGPDPLGRLQPRERAGGSLDGLTVASERGQLAKEDRIAPRATAALSPRLVPGAARAWGGCRRSHGYSPRVSDVAYLGEPRLRESEPGEIVAQAGRAPGAGP
jgi:hypothetical protein